MTTVEYNNNSVQLIYKNMLPKIIDSTTDYNRELNSLHADLMKLQKYNKNIEWLFKCQIPQLISNCLNDKIQNKNILQFYSKYKYPVEINITLTDYSTHKVTQKEYLSNKCKNQTLTQRQQVQNLHTSTSTELFSLFMQLDDEFDEKVNQLKEEINNAKNNWLIFEDIFGFKIQKLIPQYLNKEMKIRYYILYFGYIRQIDHGLDVPNGIVAIIANYYSLLDVDSIV